MVKKRSDLPPSLKKLVRPGASFAEVLNMERIYEQGLAEGNMMAYGEILTLLEAKYMGSEAPDRGSPEAKAILELAKELGNHLREKMEKSKQ